MAKIQLFLNPQKFSSFFLSLPLKKIAPLDGLDGLDRLDKLDGLDSSSSLQRRRWQGGSSEWQRAMAGGSGDGRVAEERAAVQTVAAVETVQGVKAVQAVQTVQRVQTVQAVQAGGGERKRPRGVAFSILSRMA